MSDEPTQQEIEIIVTYNDGLGFIETARALGVTRRKVQRTMEKWAADDIRPAHGADSYLPRRRVSAFDFRARSMERAAKYVGEKFGRLTVVSVEDAVYCKAGWIPMLQCRCDCGNTKTARLPNLRQGFTKSCGCLAVEWRKFVSSALVSSNGEP